MDLSPFQGEGALKLVATAVTPAVMISATAILISGVSSKHQAMSDRVRALMAEYREPATPEPRRVNIRAQAVFFRRRLLYTLSAHVLLFCATGLFVGTVILTCFMKIDSILISFSLGVLLLLISVVCEILELVLARRTMSLEIAGTLGKST
ncbi:MAG: hypothetical protein JWO80_5392 [Bryobacterales bacterium]|nr:hypothetical protein [Bryobacterales bacterium]